MGVAVGGGTVAVGGGAVGEAGTGVVVGSSDEPPQALRTIDATRVNVTKFCFIAKAYIWQVLIVHSCRIKQFFIFRLNRPHPSITSISDELDILHLLSCKCASART
jgi:hypothetical protein